MDALTPSSASLAAALDFARRAAPSGLTATQARLYSHVTRLRAGRPGISWSPSDTQRTLETATRLIEVGTQFRRAGQVQWRTTFRRAAELLEWLSELEDLGEVPVALLSAAAYQIAGYPAQAQGLLSRAGGTSRDSALLRSFLGADFPALEEGLRTVWGAPAEEGASADSDLDATLAYVAERTAGEVLRAFGIFCAAMRWGQDDRLTKAVERMQEVGSLLARTASPETWLLARLVAEVMEGYVATSLRSKVQPLVTAVDEEGRLAFDRYLRRAYAKTRALAWPSQVRGIASLSSAKSFALCTPTGSGKTTIAELAILQSLFERADTGGLGNAPLVLYLSPTRALAAEVEAKLSAVLKGLSTRTVQVTGLYGGTDWGPSDAWLTTEHPTVLICTQEKAEALLRFLGPLFVHRVRLIVVDEAHVVQWPDDPKEAEAARPGRRATPRRVPKKPHEFADSRELRLESILSRLLAYGRADRRVIALSAVAGGIEDTLARWLTGDPGAKAAIEDYRSTRQLVGALICNDDRSYKVEYDLLNGQRLSLLGRNDQPHVPQPFDPVPLGWKPDWTKPEVVMREPTLWAALQASVSAGGGRHSVLVFVPQLAEHLAKDFVELLEGRWATESPVVFQAPIDGPKADLWARCNAACADFFGPVSFEYRLLQFGVVLHHGKLPPSLARLLVEVVDRGIAHIVLATSTLSEGVNLPFETVIFVAPTRSGETLDVRSVANTIGRAGRPGHGTEGRALFVMPDKERLPKRWGSYNELITKLSAAVAAKRPPRSPLGEALAVVRRYWTKLHPFGSDGQFLNWLEATAPAEAGESEVVDALNALDQILIAITAEEDQLGALGGADLEERLQQIWKWTYARHAAADEKEMRSIFVHRGLAVKSRLYPIAAERRRMYVTSLAPRDATAFLAVNAELRARLAEGFAYAEWDAETRTQYVERVLEVLWKVPAFAPKAKHLRLQGSWRGTLRWWMRVPGAPKPAKPQQISEWFGHVSDSYLYKGAWGIGNAIGLATFELHAGELRPPSLEEWPDTGLPWATFWLKELLHWGTLDPVAAALLIARCARTRADAERQSAGYYASAAALGPNERLHPSRIKEWVDSLSERSPSKATDALPSIAAAPISGFPPTGPAEWRVWPVAGSGQVRWCDVAGYTLAHTKGESPLSARGKDLDFFLSPAQRRVRAVPYLNPE